MYILITFFTINDKVSRNVQSYGHLNWWMLISFYTGTLKGNGQRFWTLPAKPLGVGNMYGCYLVQAAINANRIKTSVTIMLIQNYIFHFSCSMIGITVTMYYCKEFWDCFECYQQLSWLCWQIDVICEFCWCTLSQVQHHVLVLFLLVHRGISLKRNHFVPWKRQLLVSFLGHPV